MATTKPRITITLEPHQYEVLKHLAGLQERSMAPLIVELVEAATPVFEKVCIAIENAKKAEESKKDELLRVAEESQKVLAPMYADAIDQLDIFIDAAKKLSEE